MSTDLIKKHEGLASTSKNKTTIATLDEQNNPKTKVYPYKCEGGFYTIGWGCRVSKPEKYKDGISVEEAEKMLNERVGQIQASLSKLITATLSEEQFIAVTCFVYNIGVAAFSKSTLLQKINENPANLIEIKTEWMRWIHIKGRPSTALKNRRIDELRVFSTNINESKISLLKQYLKTFVKDFLEFIMY